jgi:hypothetical protein
VPIPAAVLAELAARDVMAFGARGEIRAAYPFSSAPTPTQVTRAGGPAAYAMCAIDALEISAMLGHPVTITAAEPGIGCLITVHTDRDRARWGPAGAVVFAGATGDYGCSSADRTCGYINFFTGFGGAGVRRLRSLAGAGVFSPPGTRASCTAYAPAPDVTGWLEQSQEARSPAAMEGAHPQQRRSRCHRAR